MSMLMAAMLAASPVATARSEPIGAGPLAGTLTRPAGRPRATLLIIPGSGPTDRDGNNPLGVSAGSYRLLAEGLAAKGIASVRSDKRGMFGSKAAGDPNKANIALYAQDTASWIAAARKATGARCVWLAGHSEGGVVALASAGQPGVCGVVLVTTPGRPLDVVIRAQIAANPANAPIAVQADTALTALKAGRHVDVTGMHPALAQGLFNPKVQDFLIDSFRHDPAALAKAVTGPMLIVQGEHDLQVERGDAELLAKAQPRARLVVVPGMNHVLKLAPAERAANMATYRDPSLPLAPGLVDAIAGFVTGAGK
ncbi:MAG: alpha/beta fold hydrolase [Sphingomicrobium sp.]